MGRSTGVSHMCPWDIFGEIMWLGMAQTSFRKYCTCLWSHHRVSL